MKDIVDRETRSRNMARIRGKNTKPELAARRALHARGLRFRLHDKTLSGTPDMVFRQFSAVCFVHGCFWHRHKDCRYATEPKSRSEFWQAKFASNIERDQCNRKQLLMEGWRVAVIWECALRSGIVEQTSSRVEEWLRGHERELEIGMDETLQYISSSTERTSPG